MARKKVVTHKLTAGLASKVLEVVDAGLSEGMGDAEPGQMCVEAAVCYAYGEPHTDRPKCVLPSIRDFKIGINDDCAWKHLAANKLRTDYDDEETRELASKLRASGLRRLAIAQLGSNGKVSEGAWNAELRKYFLKGTSKRVKIYKSRVKMLTSQLTKALAAVKATPFGEGINPENFDFVEVDELESCFSDGGTLLDGVKTIKQANKRCEDIVQILIKLKSPGTKYLYLTEKPKAKKKAKRVVKKTKRK